MLLPFALSPRIIFSLARVHVVGTNGPPSCGKSSKTTWKPSVDFDSSDMTKLASQGSKSGQHVQKSTNLVPEVATKQNPGIYWFWV